MTDTKWTPGPWRANEDSANARIYQQNAPSIQVANARFMPDARTTKANAALIAAAPELYEALEAMHSFAKQKLDDPSRAEEMMIFVKSAAILAKARGEDQ